MSRRALSSLGKMVEEKRGDRKLRETAKEVGISAATLLRIESGRIPDVATFGKVCRWLEIDPGDFLGFEGKGSGQGDQKSTSQSQPVSISAHFKVDSTPNPETAQALAKMLLYAMSIQPQPKTVSDNGDI